jgi:hypothetical protein
MTIATQPAMPEANQWPMNERVIAMLIVSPPPHTSPRRAMRTRRDARCGTGVSTASDRLSATTYSTALSTRTTTPLCFPWAFGSNREDVRMEIAASPGRVGVRCGVRHPVMVGR